MLPRTPEMLDTMITLPPPWSAICGTTRLVSQCTLRRFTVIVRSQSASDAVSSGTHVRRDAGVAHEHVDARMRGQRRLHESLDLIASRRRRRQCRSRRSAPRARIRRRHALHSSGSLLEMTTRAPACAMASAMARPIPRVAPVISATLPSRRKRSEAVVPTASVLVPCSDGPRHDFQHLLRERSRIGVRRRALFPFADLQRTFEMNLQRS